MNNKFCLLLLQFTFFSLCWAQDVSIGEFKEYLPYNRFHAVAQDKGNIYAATEKSILVVDKKDKSQEKWSKLNGLSDVEIQTLHADENGSLIIAYTNSNIDVIKDYKVYNIRDLFNKQIIGSKIINKITTIDNLAYLTCDFGVVILDLNTLLVKDSWFTVLNNEPYQALCFAIHQDRYYLGTNNGVFSLPISEQNPADFSRWKQEDELSKSLYRFLCSYQDKLYAVRVVDNKPDSLFVYENSSWKHSDALHTKYFRELEVKNGKMLVCEWDNVKIFTENSYTRYYWYPSPHRSWQNARGAIFDENMNVWVADNSSGLVFFKNDSNKYEIIKEEGPENSSTFGLCLTNGFLAVVPGMRTEGIYPNWASPAISVMNDDQWWSHANFSQFKRANAFNSVVINPLNTNEIYMASWIGGLFKINKATREMGVYNRENSILTVPQERLSKKDTSLFVSGLVIDKRNHLWIAHTEAENLVKVKDLNTSEEVWHSINIGYDGNMVEHIFIDSRDYKWITLPRRNELVVLKGSPGNVEKSYRVDLTSQANVSGARLNCIAEDREGRIWTGHDQGVKVIYDASQVFNKTVYAKNILIEQIIGGTAYTQNLLESEWINCIAVDAANRKWIGTRSSGLFLLSPSGTEQLFHFTTDNSPLFSNQVNDIKINHENGEVFIATSSGLISYKGTATAGKDNYKEVLVYPNPVREDYHGPIAIKGLMEDSFCKITDSAGNLVWQGYAYGGQLIWNGKDFYGKRPATGVYFVMASSKTGKEKKVAKFLFVQ
ncbi:MAG: hypothetical protein LBI82_11310 [Dysgonamonadaceae bacterium]|jgi:hypothetical protein|nr:hypothetical protein [Dysgonamonadaceae bacterium]